MNTPIAIYTCEAFPDLWEDDRALLPALERVGLRGVPQRWDAPPEEPFRAGLIRSTWDYYLLLPAFLSFLDTIDAPLFNDAAVVRWNLDKRYLLQLAALGVPIVPTRYLPRFGADLLPALWQELGELVVKPTISAGSWRTLRLPPGASLPEGPVGHGKGAIAGRPEPSPEGYLVQPFLPQIGEGEWSFIFIDGAFSHALRKRPAAGDFRVQEQYGGAITLTEAAPWMLAQAQEVLALLPQVPELAGAAPPLYARVDGVEQDGRLLLMELELIEPALYMRYSPTAAERLAQGLLRRLS